MMRAFVYWNIHRRCYSVRVRGRVVAHVPSLTVSGAVFVVQPGGRARVLREGVKNVHAGIRGLVTCGEPAPSAAGRRVSYDPRRFASFFFVDTLEPIHAADLVIALTVDDRPAVFVI
jgi:hypothetical protein